MALSSRIVAIADGFDVMTATLAKARWASKLVKADAPLIAASVRKHCIHDDNMIHAFNHPILVEDLDNGFFSCTQPPAERLSARAFPTTTSRTRPTSGDPVRDVATMFIGPNQAGSLLEVGVVDSGEGPIVVHPMAARTKMPEVTSCPAPARRF